LASKGFLAIGSIRLVLHDGIETTYEVSIARACVFDILNIFSILFPVEVGVQSAFSSLSICAVDVTLFTHHNPIICSRISSQLTTTLFIHISVSFNPQISNRESRLQFIVVWVFSLEVTSTTILWWSITTITASSSIIASASIITSTRT